MSQPAKSHQVTFELLNFTFSKFNELYSGLSAPARNSFKTETREKMLEMHTFLSSVLNLQVVESKKKNRNPSATKKAQPSGQEQNVTTDGPVQNSTPVTDGPVQQSSGSVPVQSQPTRGKKSAPAQPTEESSRNKSAGKTELTTKPESSTPKPESLTPKPESSTPKPELVTKQVVKKQPPTQSSRTEGSVSVEKQPASQPTANEKPSTNTEVSQSSQSKKPVPNKKPVQAVA